MTISIPILKLIGVKSIQMSSMYFAQPHQFGQPISKANHHAPPTLKHRSHLGTKIAPF